MKDKKKIKREREERELWMKRGRVE